MQLFKFEDPILEPKRATKHSAGYDLRASKAYIVQPGQSVIVDTGVKIDMDSKDWTFLKSAHCLMLHIRSSIAMKGLMLTNGVGVVDMDYADTIGVMLRNISDEAIIINEHDRIAQLVLIKCLMHGLPVSEESRKHGFGSTGV